MYRLRCRPLSVDLDHFDCRCGPAFDTPAGRRRSGYARDWRRALYRNSLLARCDRLRERRALGLRRRRDEHGLKLRRRLLRRR